MKYVALLIVVGLSGCVTPKKPPVHHRHHKHGVKIAAATPAPAPETPMPLKNFKGEYRLINSPTPNPEFEPR